MTLFLVSILLLTACSSKTKNGGAADSTKSTNEITVWTWDPNFNVKAMKIAEEFYKKENPNFKLKIIENAQKDVVQKLNTSLSSGTTKGLPNIVLIEDYSAQSFLKSYPDAFYDLSKYFKAEDFAEYKLAPTSLNGKHYGLPFDTGVAGLYVRTDYLQKAGYTVDDLQGLDWNKYIEIGKKVKQATQGGPGNATMTISQYIYNLSFKYTPDFGYAATVSYAIVIMIVFFSIIQFKVAGDKNG